MFQKIGIIGGTGQMGSMFTRAIADIGVDCLVSDEQDLETEQRIVNECELVILSVPIEVSKEVAIRIGPKLSADQIWTDFTSVKTPILQVMSKYEAEVISAHPLFGKVSDFKGQNMLLMPVRLAESPNLVKLKRFFEDLGLHVSIIKNWQEHDKLMSYIQGLMHFIHIVFTKTLQHRGIDIEELINISSPVYRANFAFACRIISRDPDLYTHILMDNKHNSLVLGDFIQQARQTLKLIEAKKDQLLVDQLGDLKDYLADMGDRFSKESDYLITQMSRLKLNQDNDSD